MASTNKTLALVLVLLTALGQLSDADANPPPAAASIAMPRWVKRHDRRFLTGSPRVDAVVAQDGSGDHFTIKAALEKAPPGSKRFTVHVKKGLYAEVVEIYRNNVMLLGDGAGRTVITGNRSNKSKHGTPCTATVSE
jgi:pectinesterase